jgi:hypothetical protein
MNQFILNVMIVYCIASLVYILYLIFMKPEKISDFIYNNQELKEKYNNIKKNRIMVFIIGIVIGLGVIIIFDKEQILDKTLSNINVKSIIEDVSDISVI